MNYTLQNISFDELKEFLSLFAKQVLCKPISKNPKHYQKHASGFRLNNLPEHILYKIYFEEIHSEEENLLEKFLIENSKLCFKDTKIEELVDSVDENNLLTVAPELEKEILHAELTISPKQVFMLAGYLVESQQGKSMDAYHTFFLEESKLIKKSSEEKLLDKHNEKYTKLQNSYDDILSSLTIERNAVKDLKEIVKQKDSKIDALGSENMLLKEKLKTEITENGLLREKLNELEKKISDLNKLIKDNLSLKKKIDDLESELDKVKEQIISPETVRQLSIDVLEDLKSSDITEETFLNEAESFFMEDETLNKSWQKLSLTEQEKLFTIVDKMEQNSVEDMDMGILDIIENMVYYKYMIVKGLKIIFYRYLEQKSAKRTIDQKFKES